MTRYEYKVIPAPRRGERQRGARQVEDRFALTLSTLMNKMGRDGWEYQRAETLPVEERSGLTGRSTSFQNMLIFRRPLVAAEEAPTASIPAASIPAASIPTATPPAAEPSARRAALPMDDPSALAATLRPEGPRLVSSREDEGGKAPALGPAKGEQTGE